MISLSRDVWLLFGTRFVRLFAYGLISLVLLLYLAELGFTEAQGGVLLTLVLVGDIGVSLWITTRADRLGRRTMLLISSLLMIAGGVAFTVTSSFVVLLFAATIAVISPSGGEVGPFLPIEQAALSQIVPAERRTHIFAWYNLIGSFATALGSLCGGLLVQLGASISWTGPAVYRPVLVSYALLGAVLCLAFWRLSPDIEPGRSGAATARARPSLLGLDRSQGIVVKLSCLFALDAFGGGFIMQTIMAYWLHVRFGIEPATLGGVFLVANLMAGVSALAAGWLAERIGLLNTMVFTHLPSNVLLILVPLMPSASLAIALLLIRFSISQMDVPTRQAYVMAVVTPGERAAAAGVTGVARSIGAALSPALATRFLGCPSLLGVPFLLAGTIKVAYDLLLWRAFASHTEETGSAED